MSFDLFVYFTPTPGLKDRWEAALADAGIAYRFPEGVDPLQPSTDLEDFPYFEVGPRKRGSEGDEDDSAHIPERLRELEAATTHQAFFTTSAGRSATGLELQMIGAAALAHAGQGVVMDPQERGYMDPVEAIAYARETVEQYRNYEAAQEKMGKVRDAQLAELELRWRWFRYSFAASCSTWAALAIFLALMGPLGIGAAARWVPFATLLPVIAAIVFAVRGTRNLLETLGLAWPLPGLIGVASAAPPLQAFVYWWGRGRYEDLRLAISSAR